MEKTDDWKLFILTGAVLLSVHSSWLHFQFMVQN